jgi:tetratricopeptide (TPR) repeat protein
MKVLEIDPKFVQVYYNLAVIYARKRQFTEAVDAARRFLQANPSGVEAENLRTLIEQCEKELTNENEF